MKQQGFSIITAIFVLVVVGLLGGYMVRMTGVEASTSNLAVQGVRTYLSARAGLEWAMVKISTGSTCTSVDGKSYTLDGFNVNLTCTSQSFTEGTRNYSVYTVNAQSQYGSFGSANYVARGAKMTIIQ